MIHCNPTFIRVQPFPWNSTLSIVLTCAVPILTDMHIHLLRVEDNVILTNDSNMGLCPIADVSSKTGCYECTYLPT